MVLLLRLVCGIFIFLLFPNPSRGIERTDPKMVYFSEGEIVMGSPIGQGKNNEHPQHKVYLNAFYLDKYEASNHLTN